MLSRRATAAERATPVHRDGREEGSTGHGSIFSSSRTFWMANSASATGRRNLDIAEFLSVCGFAPPPWPLVPPRLRPNSSQRRFGSTSFLWLKVYDLAQCS